MGGWPRLSFHNYRREGNSEKGKSKEAGMAEATTGSLNQSLTDNRWYWWYAILNPKP
jgi:hypothetical protein